MANFTLPDRDTFLVRFPAFSNTEGAAIDAALALTAAVVGDNWITQICVTEGALLYAAHTLTLDGHGTGTEATLARDGMLGFSQIRSAALSVSRNAGGPGGSGGGDGDDPLNLTTFGKRFKEVRRRSLAGPRVAT